MSALLLRLRQRRRSYLRRVLATQAANLLAFWPMNEASGTAALDASGNGRNGAYKGSGEPLLGQSAPPFTLPSFDGSNDYMNAYSASLAGAFNASEGTFAAWCQVSSSGVWSDATTRRIGYFAVDTNNRFIFEKTTAANQLDAISVAGGTARTIATIHNATGLFHYAATWSKTSDRLRIYIDGCQAGVITGLGTWAGALASTTTTLGAQGFGASVWSGLLGQVALWSRELTPYEVAALHRYNNERMVVFEGDSRTVGQTTTISYPRQLGLAAIRTPVIAVSGQPVANFATTTTDAAFVPGAALVAWGGVNDALTVNAATIYSRLQTYWAARRAAGYKVIACTEIDAQDASRNAVSWHGTIYPALNTLIKSDPSLYDGLADLGADARLQNANDTTYFNADKVHLTTAGYAVVAGLVAPAIAAL